MGELLPEFHHEEKAIRYPAGPALRHARFWWPIECAVDFHRAEKAAVVGQFIHLLIDWVKVAVPGAFALRIRPARGADTDIALRHRINFIIPSITCALFRRLDDIQVLTIEH